MPSLGTGSGSAGHQSPLCILMAGEPLLSRGRRRGQRLAPSRLAVIMPEQAVRRSSLVGSLFTEIQEARPFDQRRSSTGQESEPTGQESEPTGQESESTGQESESTGQKSESEQTGQESELTGQESELTGQESEQTGQKSESTGQKSE